MHLIMQAVGMMSALGSPLLTTHTLADGVALQKTSLSLSQALEKVFAVQGLAHVWISLLALVLVAPVCHTVVLSLRQPFWLRALWGWSMMDVFAIAIGVTTMSLRSLSVQ